MKKRLAIENLDCPSCGAKIEAAIAKIPGVESVSVSFMTQKVTLEAPEDLFVPILEAANRACKKVLPKCRIR